MVGTWQVHRRLVVGLREGYLCDTARIIRYLGRFRGAGVFGTIWSSRVNTGALVTTCEAISWLPGDNTRVLVYV